MGESLSKENEIQEETIRFFSHLLSKQTSHSQDKDHISLDLLENIPNLASQNNNQALLRPFTMKELKSAIFSFPPDKEIGTDGYTTLFFRNGI